ncbi:MAG: hypothetical protein EXS08_05400 [Planctomycetes bacterium]|nr:hypothetical protein [Planctomycetota bacterium]
MKKTTKFHRSRQPRGRRSSKGGRSPLGEILSLREQLRETLIGAIRSAVAATTRALVERVRRDGYTKPAGEPFFMEDC